MLVPYRSFGLLHAHLLALRHRLAADRGQGTVEYVALIVLIAGILAAVVSVTGGKDHGIGTTIVNKLKGSIDKVGGG